MTHLFEDIEVKENAIELLEQTLRSKRKKCMIGTGAMTDPYIHLERDIRMTRQALEVIYKYGFGVTLHTKSNRVLDDLALLKKINTRSKVVVQMTLTTYDEALCKKIEPNVSSTKERFETLKILHEAGIETVVWLSPLLPFINDTMDNVQGLMDYVVKARVKGIIYFGAGVTLREGNRDYFYKQLDAHFPGMKQQYMTTFGHQYECHSPNHVPLTAYIEKTCKKHNILYQIKDVFNYLSTFPEKGEQLKLF
jgi:DNA repair photolyase